MAVLPHFALIWVGCSMVKLTYARSLVAVASILGAGCKGPPSAAQGSASASAPNPIPTASSVDAADDEVRPVYPQSNDPPHPTAARYCELVYEVAESKRKECCPSVAFGNFRPTTECVRTLSFALHSASVGLDPAALDACEAAIRSEAKQCDWGGNMPSVCKGIIRGTLDDGKSCKSTLECKEGTFCKELGVSTPGTCTKPQKEGERCSVAPDSLASFVAQDAEDKHPVCEGVCDRRKCIAPLALGAECRSAIPCGPGKRCQDMRCVNDTPPKLGEACSQSCEPGARCVAGKCAPEKRIGDGCEADAECRSAFCDKGSGGKCAMNCQVIRAGSSPTPSATATPKVSGSAKPLLR